MISVAIVYHSGSGHTARQAIAVREGVDSVPGVTAQLIAVEAMNDHWETLEQAGAIIFGAPTYMGSLSGSFKVFMDASVKVWFGLNWRNKIAAGFTNSAAHSGDKLNSLIQLAVFAAQHGMIWAGLDLMPGNNSSAGSPADLNRLGSWLGAMAQSNIDQGPEESPSASDLQTSHYLGQRVANATLRWQRGAEAS